MSPPVNALELFWQNANLTCLMSPVRQSHVGTDRSKSINLALKPEFFCRLCRSACRVPFALSHLVRFLSQPVYSRTPPNQCKICRGWRPRLCSASSESVDITTGEGEQ